MKFFQQILLVFISSLLSVIGTVYILHHKYPTQSDGSPPITSENINESENTSDISKISTSYRKSIILVDAIQKSVSSDEELSTGTGFVFEFNNNKYIATNEHVIHGTKDIQIELFDNSVVSAEIVGSDYDLDLAILKPTDSNALSEIPSLPLSTDKTYQIGATVIAMGFPLDIGFTVTSGIISATEKSFDIENRAYEDLIQTDAAINPGNSGGPLIDLYGKVIGINTAITRDTQGIGFAIPAHTLLSSLETLITEGSMNRPFIGVSLVENENKVSISSVIANGPADKAGIEVNDIVISLNGIEVSSAESFISMIKQKDVDENVEIVIERIGIQQNITLTILNKTDVMNSQD